MQDLLKEEDFISKKIYNPWKHFLMFYIIAAVEVISFFIFARKMHQLQGEMIIGVLLIGYFLSPLAMGFIMFFSKKRKSINFQKNGFLITVYPNDGIFYFSFFSNNIYKPR